MKYQIAIYLFFVGCLFSFAQNSISGKIIDQNNEPIPFANVILYQKGVEKAPKGVVSDADGKFLFESITNGTYQLEISVLGFKTKKSEEFELTSDKIIDFTIEEENQKLDEVVIKAKRPVIRQTAEKLVVDLEKSDLPNANLQDVMRRVPGVLVTNNGISIAGKSGVRILINGKTTEYMDVETLLRDLPADNIAKVEVVEQPGAEYDASGTGAIINIILKKNVKLGTHGSVTLWAGEDEGFEYGTRASIASYKNKINWQASIGHSQSTWRDDLFLVRNVTDTIYDQTTISPFKPINNRASGNIDYYINNKHSIGIGGSLRNRISERVSTSETIIAIDNQKNTLFSENGLDSERTNFNINPYYEYKTETDKLTLDFNYIDYRTDNTNNLYDVAGSTVNYRNRRYLQDGKYTINTYRADYSKEFSDKFKLSVGGKFSDVATDNDLKSYQENGAGVLDFRANESSRFYINESIFAMYSKINVNVSKWTFSGGLRYEDSNTKGTSNFLKDGYPTTEVKKRPISKLFPSASLSRKVSENLGVNLSYSYRIRRPSYNSLNSFENYLDPFSAEIGNPELKPAFTNNYQFNLTYDGQPFFTIGYSETEDAIFNRIRQDGNQIRRQVVNVEHNKNWNFRLFAPLSFVKDLDGYTGVIVVNNDFQSQLYDLNLNKWNLYWFIQANYTLPWDIDFQLSANYGTGALEGQIEVDWLADLDFSFSKKFMDDKLKASLGFNSMLNRGFVGNIDYGNNSRASVENNGSRQNIQLRLTYSFGSKFGKKKKRNTRNDEENRIKDNN